jgi:hypothetical protein
LGGRGNPVVRKMEAGRSRARCRSQTRRPHLRVQLRNTGPTERPSSCPALGRASTSWPHSSKKDVDGRDEPGHDEKANRLEGARESPQHGLSAAKPINACRCSDGYRFRLRSLSFGGRGRSTYPTPSYALPASRRTGQRPSMAAPTSTSMSAARNASMVAARCERSLVSITTSSSTALAGSAVKMR